MRPVHQCELCVYIFYIISNTESIDILIKGSKYWVGAPTSHQLSLPREVDSHNPCEGYRHPSKVCDTDTNPEVSGAPPIPKNNLEGVTERADEQMLTD